MPAEPAIPVELVQHALRAMRAGTYRLESTPDGVTVSLVMAVSPAGRRNAAERLLRSLAEYNLTVAAPDPLTALTDSPIGLRVVPADG
ncbi:hypothetical protein N8J89_22235 [Crossiella sp. CA-258035]|uniref:hypothetical protein n=1 Tax=Crossiella sp. CA-258035 TaxID=2981138 RepID=UPI0024BC7EFF|nr:hypothetical protein [Crossiella sp. CA-258035]WHT15853.1 hypothetical protein N8J89_22235 [Crossiella sp. CA-258035]